MAGKSPFERELEKKVNEALAANDALDQKQAESISAIGALFVALEKRLDKLEKPKPVSKKVTEL